MYTEVALTLINIFLLVIIGGIWHLRKNSDKIEQSGRTNGYLLVMIDQKMKEFLRINNIEDDTEIGDDGVNNKYKVFSEMAKIAKNKPVNKDDGVVDTPKQKLSELANTNSSQ